MNRKIEYFERLNLAYINCNIAIFILTVFLFSSNLALASGFASDFYSTSGLANSYAGSSTGVHDASDSHLNPSILSNIESGQVISSLSYLNYSIDVDAVSAKRGALFGGMDFVGLRNDDAGIDNIVIPTFYFAKRISKRLVNSFNVTSPFGLSTVYDKNWIGRYHAIESHIQTVNLSNAVSYDLDDKIALGLGIQAQYIKSVLTKAVFDGSNDYLGKLKADDWGYGYSLGLKYDISNNMSFGFGYRSKIDHKLEGKSQVQGLNMYSNISAKVATPESLILGFKFDLARRVQFLLDLNWVRWSRIRAINIEAPQNTILDSDDLKLNLKDSWRYSLGLNYKYSSGLKLRYGVAYEEGSNSSSVYRSPRIPTGDKIWLSFGFGYKLSQNTIFDFAYLHQFYKKTSSTINNDAIGSLDANYQTRLDSISFAVNYMF